MNISATGASASAGEADLAAVSPGILTASGASASAGRAAIATQLPVGSVCDLAIWPAALPDPAMSLVEAVGTPDGTGRAYLSASAPTAYTTSIGQLWNAAAYVAATGTWQETTPVNTATKAITDVQIEKGPPGNLLAPDAADYRDRMLYTQGSTTVGSVTTWDALPTRVQGNAQSGTWCGQLANTGGLSPYSMQPLPGAMVAVVVGASYRGAVSISLARANAAWYAQILWYDASYNLLSTTVGTAMTHPGSLAYQQGVARGTAPSSAAWAAVVPAITPAATGDGELAWVDCHRIWSLSPALTSAPKAFTPARSQTLTLRANRVNYAFNPSFTQDIVGWWGLGGTGSTVATWDSTVGHQAPGALKIAATYGVGSAVPQCGSFAFNPGHTYAIAIGRTGGTYTLSTYVLPTAGSPTIRMYAVIGGGQGLYVPGTTTATVVPDTQGWYRLSATVTIPQSMSGSMAVLLNVSAGDWAAYGQNLTWWVDDVLVEPSPLLGTYFDATLPSPDYVWESTPLRSRSHYYQNFRFLQYRLDALLADALPAGVAHQVLYAQPDP